MFYTYILKSKVNSSYYFGSCKNIKQRLNLHNRGLVKSTKRYVPWGLVYKEDFKLLKEARAREAQFKSWKSRFAIEHLIEHSKIL